MKKSNILKSVVFEGAVVCLAAFILSLLIRTLKVSGSIGMFDFMIESVVLISSYCLAWIISFFCLYGRYKDFLIVLGTSFFGSLVYIVYNLIRVIRGDWWYISKHQNEMFERHLSPNIGFAVFFFFLFLFLFSSLKFFSSQIRNYGIKEIE